MQGVNGTIFDLGKAALYAHQMGMNITGHNIANVNTPGYSRQRMTLENNAPFSNMYGQSASGVRIADIQRIHDRFLSARIQEKNQDLGLWEARKDAADRVESIFTETSEYGISLAVTEFFNAWQDLAVNPDGLAERSVLLEKARGLAMRIRMSRTELDGLQKELDLRIADSIGLINEMTQRVAQLNLKISQAELIGESANDLRDSRDELLRELSLQLDINTYEDDQFMVTVSMTGSGIPLVEKGNTWELFVKPGGVNAPEIFRGDPSIPANKVNDGIRLGKTGGLLAMREEIAERFSADLDTLAGQIITSVNALHQSGIDIQGNPGGLFFSGSSALDMDLAVSDTNAVAAALPGGGVGDNRNASAMAALADSPTMNGNTETFTEFYHALIADVGIMSRNAEGNLSYEKDMAEQLETFRESVSGVSLDEEMVNLIQYQHAYNAATKLIQAADEMLETLMNIV